MHPRKTELALTVLQAHRAPLDLRQRRALILCDGKRGLDELCQLLGTDAPALIGELMRQGYLQDEAAAVPIATPAVPVPAATPTPTTERRRSMVAARIYVLDILALQRNTTAQQLHRVLQATREEGDTVNAIRLALAHLPAMTSEGYAQRVRGRLQEVLPVPHLATVLEASPPPAA